MFKLILSIEEELSSAAPVVYMNERVLSHRALFSSLLLF